MAQGKVDLANTVRLTLMAELTASISHEIKQPLAAIITNANYSLGQLAKATPNLKEVRQAIQEIVDDGNRANSIISRVRNLLMREPPERAPVDVNEVIRDVLQFLRAEADQNRIDIQLQLAEHLSPLHADRVQLQQAFMNVLINSIEALRSVAEPQRKIVIQSEEQSEAIVVRIEDSAPGLPPDVSDRLFEPFFTTRPEGMGLGLSISRSIVEAHAGRLSYIPRSRGAMFEFAFPREAGELS